LSGLAREGWLDRHAYLRRIAELCARVDDAVASLDLRPPSIASFEGHHDEFLSGVPLLQSSNVVVDLEPAGRAVIALVQRLASDGAVESIGAEAGALAVQLAHDRTAPTRVVSWLLGDESWTPVAPGLLRYLGWTAVRQFLAPLVAGFDRWRDEERWLRNYCPTCGSGPAMAQLVGKDPGRRRLLCCGRCGTRWQYKRARCPFCEHDSDRAVVLSIEGEGGLRIDHCEACRGYLKTYDGQGDEVLLLADWSSLHLDLLARERGLERLAASLYELPPDPEAAAAVTP
jgi:FdhE protein